MAFQILDTRTITLSPLEVPGAWTKLDTRSITITPLEVTPPPTVGWVKLATRNITLTPTEAPPVPPEYKLIQHTEYPDAKTYVGKAEQCTFDFKLTPEQIPGTTWLGKKVADIFVNEVTKHNSKMLDLKVYEDTTPIFWTNYRIIATATASPLPWAVIIVAILAILFIVAITFLIREIKTIDWGAPAAVGIAIAPIILLVAALAGVGIVAATKRGGKG